MFLAEHATKSDFSSTAVVENSIASIDYRAIRKVTNIVGIERMIQAAAAAARPGGNAGDMTLTQSALSQANLSNEQQYTAIVYGYITRFDLDGPESM